MTVIDVIKVLAPSSLAVIIGILLTPILTNFLYKNEMWKKKGGKKQSDGSATPVFDSLHKEKEVGTPKMGGIVIWASAFLAGTLVWIVSRLAPTDQFLKLDFVSRSQTWLPFGALIIGGLTGLIDDFMEVKGTGDHVAGGLSLKKRLSIVTVIGLLSGGWFYFKLSVASVAIPFFGQLHLGLIFIPIFALVMIAIYSGGVIDGIDGLAGGVFAAIFAAYSVIAFFQHQIDLSAFCAVVVGGLLAFLWFNIPPARFYMSETGSMALTVSLTVVAFMTDTLGDGHGLSVLPIIALPLVITTLSNILQNTSKKFRRGKKIFHIAPVHHHFEAVGWPAYKVTMRYWIISVVAAGIGIILALIRV